jgi:hypothetical protein
LLNCTEIMVLGLKNKTRKIPENQGKEAGTPGGI